jgi:hypothetical protein
MEGKVGYFGGPDGSINGSEIEGLEVLGKGNPESLPAVVQGCEYEPFGVIGALSRACLREMTGDDCMELVSDPALLLSSVTRPRSLFNVVSNGPVEYFAKSAAVPLLLEARSLVAPSSKAACARCTSESDGR